MENCDSVYYERNQLVALLARMYPSGVKVTAIESWDPAWHNCVYIDFPWGQASWHFHDRDRHLFEGLPKYQGQWDGHTTEQKYEELRNGIKQYQFFAVWVPSTTPDGGGGSRPPGGQAYRGERVSDSVGEDGGAESGRVYELGKRDDRGREGLRSLTPWEWVLFVLGVFLILNGIIDLTSRAAP